MNRVRTFFVEEARECLHEIEAELADPSPSTEALYAAVRRLRGSAQMARYGSLAEDAWPLEEVLRRVSHGEMAWDEKLETRVQEETASLARAVDAVREGSTAQDDKEPLMEGQAPDTAGADAIVPLEELEYSGRTALDRAESLRSPVEDAIVNGDPPGPILDELFDLIRLGRK
ncbi:MAG: Hpt domain-containing protein [Candidatus Longimicrobiales bacterium M2_2A_002]